MFNVRGDDPTKNLFLEFNAAKKIVGIVAKQRMKKSMNKRKNTRNLINGQPRELTPFERLVLEVFTPDEPWHDCVTVAAWMNGGPGAVPVRVRRHAIELCRAVINDLLEMGYLASDSSGWVRLAVDVTKPDAAIDSPQPIDQEASR